MKYISILLPCALIYFTHLPVVGQSDRVQLADTYLSRMAQFGFNGSVLIAQNDKILLNKGYGIANTITSQPNEKDMVYSLGSIVKPFTATLIMNLVQNGELEIQDNISEYLDQVSSDKMSITIHHLLSHSSGLPGSIGLDTESISKPEFLKKAMDSKLLFKPGERYHYSNVAYTILAMIIEEVTGSTYEQYLFDTILKPAGMFNTGYTLPKWDPINVAHNSSNGVDNGTFLDRENYPTWHLIGNGGMLSTTEDMFNFYQFMKDDKLLTPATKDIMFTPVFMEDAYGWVNIDDGGIIQHNGGGTDGNGALFRWFPKEDMFLMIFTNSPFLNNPGFMAVQHALTEILFGNEIAIPPAIGNILTKTTELASGNFTLSNGASIYIEPFEKGVKIMAKNQQAVELLFNRNQSGRDFSEWNLSLGKIIQAGLEKGNYESFQEITSNPDKLKNDITMEIEMEGYSKPKAKLLYSLQVQPEIYISKIAISEEDFSGENMLFTMVFKDGQFRGLGVDFGSADLPEMYFIQVAENQFSGYSFSENLSKTMYINQDENKGLTGLKFSEGEWLSIENSSN